MVAPKAEMGVGHVGGSFDLRLFDDLLKDCKFDASAAKAEPMNMPGRHVISVSTRMLCNSKEGASNQDVVFMVENDMIAGFYVPTTPGPVSD